MLPGLAIVNVTLLMQSTHNAQLVNCSFHDNVASALVVNNTNITLTGNSDFIHNYVLCGGLAYSLAGGGMTAFGSNLTFTGNTTFLNNSAGLIEEFACCAGVINALDNTVFNFSGINNFINNLGGGNGGATYILNYTVLGTSNFINNFAYSGAAIYASDNCT